MADRLIDLLDTARRKYKVYEAEKDHRMRTAKTEAEFEAEASTYELRHSFYARELRNNGVEIPVRCRDCKHCKLCYPEKQIDKEATPGWYCKEHKSYRRPDDFCSYGERREGE